MVEYLILGLLMYNPLSIYDMKKAMEKSINHFFSASFGSLHPALKKLHEKGFVTFMQTLERGRSKKTYTITEEGRKAFLEWLQNSTNTDIVREPSLLKMFFLGHLAEEARIPVLENYLSEVEKNLVALKRILTVLQAIEVPEEKLVHKTYQLATLEFGVAYYAFVKEWYERKFPVRD